MLPIGLIPNVPNRSYHSDPAASRGRLNVLRHQSPAHLKYEMDNPTEQTAAMKIGDAFHTLVLQPNLFEASFVVAPACCEAIKKSDGKRCSNPPLRKLNGEWLCGQHGKGDGRGDDNRNTLSLDEANQIQAMRNAMMSNRWLNQLLAEREDTELTCVWEENGIRNRARFDAPVWGRRLLLDLKTTDDASPEGFRRSVYKFGLDLQAAHYLTGAEANGMDVDAFVFGVVEKSPPYAVGVYRLSDLNLSAVRAERSVLLARYGECMRTNHFPDYGDTIEDIEVAGWAMKKIEMAVA